MRRLVTTAPFPGGVSGAWSDCHDSRSREMKTSSSPIEGG